MNFVPHDYQAYAIDYIETHPIAAVLLDMGLGKTVISLTAIADLLFDSFVPSHSCDRPTSSSQRHMAC